MKIYHYGPLTGEYITEGDARPNPLESGEYLIPAHATIIEPPTVIEGMTRVFNGSEWLQVEDHRGKIIYSTVDAHQNCMIALGPIAEGYTDLIPGEYPEWNGSKWIRSEVKAKEAESNQIKANLIDIDIKSIRSIREYLIAKFPDAPVYLNNYENEAISEREKLK